MQIRIGSVMLATALALGACNGHANGIVGHWLTGEGRSTIELVAQDDGLCGRIVWLKKPLDEAGKPKTDTKHPDPALRSRPVLGLKLLWGFKPKGDAAWSGGRIYDPESGKTYHCRMKLQGDELKIRGSLDRWGLAGRTTRWTRTAKP